MRNRFVVICALIYSFIAHTYAYHPIHLAMRSEARAQDIREKCHARALSYENHLHRNTFQYASQSDDTWSNALRPIKAAIAQKISKIVSFFRASPQHEPIIATNTSSDALSAVCAASAAIPTCVTTQHNNLLTYDASSLTPVEKEYLLAYERAETIAQAEDEQLSLSTRSAERCAAIRATTAAPTKTTVVYELTSGAQKLLTDYAPESIPEFQQLTGNQVQHVLQRECLELLDTIASNKPLYDAQFITEGTVHMVDLGQTYNRFGYVIEAFEQIDICWQLQEICCGTLLGVYDAGTHLAHMARHPIDAVVGMAEGTVLIAWYLGKTLVQIGYIAIEKGSFDQPSPTAQQLWNDIRQLTAIFTEKSTREKTRCGVAYLAELAILKKASTSASSWLAGATAQARAVAQQVSPALQTVAVNISESVDQAVLCARKLAVEGTEQVIATAGGPALRMRMGDAVQTMRAICCNTLHYVTAYCNDQWPALSKNLVTMFNSYEIVIENVQVKMTEESMRHIFKGIIGNHKKLLGLHHDPNGYLKTTVQNGMRMVEFLEDYGNGFHEARVWTGFKWVNKTFFPDAMTADEILILIHDCLASSCKTIEFDQLGRAVVRSHIKDGIYLKVVFDKCGLIVTAYPYK